MVAKAASPKRPHVHLVTEAGETDTAKRYADGQRVTAILRANDVERVGLGPPTTHSEGGTDSQERPVLEFFLAPRRNVF